MPKEIGPLVFEASTRKNWKIKQAMHNNAWISKIKMDANLYIPHLNEYIQLWVDFNNVQFREEIKDTFI
jgi:hypothetical protein